MPRLEIGAARRATGHEQAVVDRLAADRTIRKVANGASGAQLVTKCEAAGPHFFIRALAKRQRDKARLDHRSRMILSS